MVLEESQQLIRKEKQEESKRSEASGQLYNVLVNFVHHQKLLASRERNLLQAQHLANKIELTAIFATQKLKSELRP